MIHFKIISLATALTLLAACSGGQSAAIPASPESQDAQKIVQGRRCIGICPTPTPPPVFVVDAASNSVKVYAAPYTAAPAIMVTSGLTPTDAAYDSVSNQLVVGAGNVLLTFGAPFSSGETSLAHAPIVSAWRLAMMVPQSDAIQITPSIVEYASPSGIGASQVPLTGSLQGTIGFSQSPGVWYPHGGVMAVDRFGHVFLGETQQGGPAPSLGVEGRNMSDGSVYVPLFDESNTALATAMAFDVSGDLWVAHYDSASNTSNITEFSPPVAGQAPTVINTIPASSGLNGIVTRLAFTATSNLVAMLPREILVFDAYQSNMPYASLVMGGSCAATTGCQNVNMVIDHQQNIIAAVNAPGGSYIQVYSDMYTQNQQPLFVNALGNLVSPQGMTGGDFVQIRPVQR